MNNEIQLEEIMQAFRNDIEAFLEKGYTLDEVRDAFIHDLQITYSQTEHHLAFDFIESPTAFPRFVLQVNQTIGAINQVLVMENNLDPIDIEDFDLRIVSIVERQTGKDIHEIVEDIERGQQ